MTVLCTTSFDNFGDQGPVVGTAPDVWLFKFETKFFCTYSYVLNPNPMPQIFIFQIERVSTPRCKSFRGHSVSRPVPTTGKGVSRYSTNIDECWRTHSYLCLSSFPWRVTTQRHNRVLREILVSTNFKWHRMDIVRYRSKRYRYC